jgi:hypothetical protein
LRAHHGLTSSKLSPAHFVSLSLFKLSSIQWFSVRAVPIAHSIFTADALARFAVNMRTPSKDIKVEGQTKIHVDIAASGNHTNRHFCGDCGSYVLELGFPFANLL